MTEDFFSEHLSSTPVIAILRGLEHDETVAAAQECWAHGITLVEVPLQGDDARRALATLAGTERDAGRFIGAGTICSPDDVREAVSLGAEFLVAPGVFPDALETARELGIPILPGVMTPTEVSLALSHGATTQKLFPAEGVSIEYLSALRGPFPQVQFVAVGGITPENAQRYIEHGASSVGVGGSLLKPGAIRAFAMLNAPK